MARRIGFGEALAGVCGVVLLAAMFMDWFGVDITAGDIRGADAVARQAGGSNAWQSFELVDLVLLLTATAAVAVPLGRVTGGLPRLPLRPGLLVGAAGLAGLVAALIGLTDPPVEEGTFLGGLVVDASREAGAFVGVAACAGILIGGLVAAREQGLDSAPDVLHRHESADHSGGGEAAGGAAGARTAEARPAARA